MTATLEFIDTADGPFGVLIEQGDVIAAGWTSDRDALLDRIHPSVRPEDVVMASTGAAGDAVRAFYADELDAVMSVPVRQRGTELQQSGWRALRRITPGRPLSYGEFAVELGSPSAVRAAASVCARNAVALFVPCHRVLRSDGSMGGFAWGVEVKRALLTRESR